VAAKLRAIETQPDERIAETLEELVAKARTGEIVGFVALVNYRESTGSSRAGHWERRDALIAFELWKRRMLDDYDTRD